ncbi:13241_t:CDS:2, partial [Funneliformis caledonium]
RSRTRHQVKCFCSKCKEIYVDLRTKNKHSINATNTSISLQDENNLIIESSRYSFINKEFFIEYQEDVSQLDNLVILSSKMRKRNRKNTLLEYDKINQEVFSSNEDDHKEINNDIDNINNYTNYSPPNYDFPENFNDLQNIDEDWIIVFILRFQTRFRLPDIAIDTLIKFVKHVLTELDHERFKNFSTSLYTTRKKLGLKHQFVTFSVCSSYHKLQNIDDVEQYTIREQKVIKKCDHIQFPNNHHHSLQKCDTPLSEQKELGGNKIVNSPLLIYPMA